ncbi:response regulator transcription factor [Lactobacillus gigeriorum]|uniref:DNA-binding response regulator n=1 Tax=Lactobacillus gigeriorum DSM 23908 = CRBIP 24.85 TaxID=1423751 RepID=I7LD44_9LACO|nr:winged helix-turn-helix domain-containing protein [Lactobacillus gigeriorum]KRN10555.1 DNA-binding response regulator [Lactobacillus gigeriorum DSM 23908 = CRBIP 24.85]CCI87026.1 DNA-binding response regulator [Lactobacillus gigeriorum DSM 23908 = CRBIP 24.85]
MNKIILMTKNITLFTGLTTFANDHELRIYNALSLAKAVQHSNSNDLCGIILDIHGIAEDALYSNISAIREHFAGPIIVLNKVMHAHIAKKLFQLKVSAYLVSQNVDLVLAQLESLLWLSDRKPLLPETKVTSTNFTVVHLGDNCDLRIDFKRYNAFINEQSIFLTPKEFKLLKFLLDNEGQVLSREQLLDGVWHYDDDYDSTRIVDMHISHLRDKLEKDPKHPEYIKTVRGFGYMLDLPAQD